MDDHEFETYDTGLKATLREGLRDPRLLAAVGADLYGMASTFAYAAMGGPGAAGDAADIVTAPMQTGLIHKMYGDELGTGMGRLIKAISLAEEMLPGPTDLVPSATIAHFYAANQRLKSYRG